MRDVFAMGEWERERLITERSQVLVADCPRYSNALILLDEIEYSYSVPNWREY